MEISRMNLRGGKTAVMFCGEKRVCKTTSTFS
jgi:hypothetical protein